MVVFGIILIVVALGLVGGWFWKKKTLETLQGVERKTAGELQELIKEIGGEIGGGSYRELVELAGDIDCESPLKSPLGERDCVYYRMSVKREYEEEYYDTDSDGNQVRKTRRGSETNTSNTENRDFHLKDDTGRMLVSPDGANWDTLTKSVSKFEPDRGSGSLSFGGFSFSLGQDIGRGRRTLGYRYEEYIMPLDKRTLVVGQVTDEDGRVAIRKGGKRFIITTKSKEELVKGVKTAMTWFIIIAGVCAASGIGLTIYGLVADS